MNVIFHTTAAIGVAVLLTKTDKIEHSKNTQKQVFQTSVFTFIVAVLSHGLLDYIPHCYPINSKIDAFLGLIIIFATIFLTNRRYRLIVALSFLGSIFPDLVDLLPTILNKQFGLNLPEMGKIFPWHWRSFSGSIYVKDCQISTLNHVLVLSIIGIVCWLNKTDFKRIFLDTTTKRASK